jgi:hypothetical protein
MTGDDQHKRSFGDKLAHLIETVHPPDRGPYSYREIEAGITEHPGSMTAAYINQLVKGRQPHPRIHHVEALASFFGVPTQYFFDDDLATKVDDQLAQVTAWRDEEARHIAERVAELGPRDRATVSHLIDGLREYEQMPRQHRRRRKSSDST